MLPNSLMLFFYKPIDKLPVCLSETHSHMLSWPCLWAFNFSSLEALLPLNAHGSFVKGFVPLRAACCFALLCFAFPGLHRLHHFHGLHSFLGLHGLHGLFLFQLLVHHGLFLLNLVKLAPKISDCLPQSSNPLSISHYAATGRIRRACMCQMSRPCGNVVLSRLWLKWPPSFKVWSPLGSVTLSWLKRSQNVNDWFSRDGYQKKN